MFNLWKKENNKEKKMNEQITNCKICLEITSEKNSICKKCFMEYFPKIKKFVDNNPNISYAEALFNKKMPVPRRVLCQ